MKMTRTTAYPDSWPFHAPILLLLLFFFLSTHILAQVKQPEPSVTVTLMNRSFPEALAIIESRIPYKFAYSTELAQGQKNISITAVGEPLSAFLQRLFQGTSITWQLIGDQIVLQAPVSPSRVTISGYVKDAGTSESLIGASVYLPSSGVGVRSNGYGFYSITVAPSDTLDLAVSYIGYKTLYTRVPAGETTLTFQLQRDSGQESINQLVVARDSREDNVKKNQTSLVDLSHEMIVAAPSVSGSGDVISSVEMLPGVQAGIDGSPGYFVRGGNSGQNLILLDDATLYNPSHIFGLVGIFNPPTVKHASLLKGGFPASYGDHISSVLDVAMKDGSTQQTGGSVQMGTVSSAMTLYGPLQKDRSSYLVSARRSTTDILLQPLLHNNYFSHYYFYDVNAKLNFQLTSKDRLLLSFYTGRDNNTYTGDSTSTAGGIGYSMNFGNTAFTLRWNHQYSAKLFGHSSVEYNKYHQFLSATQEGFFAQLYSGIRDVNVKTGLDWFLSPAHTITMGADYLYQALSPASLSGQVPPADSSVTIVPSGIPSKTAGRTALYAGDEMRLGERWQLYAGVRTPFYTGPGAHYFSVEPRLSLLYLIDPETSVKLSYTTMHQYIHLVQSYNASFPAEIWIGSSDVVKPQVSQEFSAGLYKNFSANTFQASLELYYKKMGNQLLFGGGGDSQTIDNTIEKQLIFGKAWSYGAEFFLRKNRGRWTGWLAYTLAYAYEQFDSLNEGETFPFAYDRRQMLDLSLAYSISPHWKIATNFLIASGRAFSLSPDSSYILDPSRNHNPLYDNPRQGVGAQGRGRGRQNGQGFQSQGSWDIVANNYRLSPYNRLDLNVHYTKVRKTGGHTLTTEWIFSVYNVYARPNNSLVYRTLDPAKGTVIAKQLPLIPVIPSITYSLSF